MRPCGCAAGSWPSPSACGRSSGCRWSGTTETSFKKGHTACSCGWPFSRGRSALDHVGLLDPALSAGSATLALRLERGTISISIEDILAFGLTLWAAFLLSAFIRFALQEEVYPRRGVSRGLSYAYSRLVHYVILAIGFLVGLGVLGMDLTKVSVLAGAFGVGIGFGLQDVVNNFVCGLILLFESSVHVGDIVEVGNLTGEVRRIGIRASTVRTYQGADIIVRNSQFITANVTNWTLSDQLRRIDLPVGVNYGAAPQQVIGLLEKAAAAHPAILKDPPPQALLPAGPPRPAPKAGRSWRS